jgi:hypothetical protein
MLSAPTYAYIGPGMGGGVIVALLGFGLAIILGLFGIIYYPLKRAFLNWRSARSVSALHKSSDKLDFDCESDSR